MVDFYSCKLWDKILPKPLANDLIKIEINHLSKILVPNDSGATQLLDAIQNDLPALHKFLSLVHSLHLSRLDILSSKEQVYECVGVPAHAELPPVPLGCVMKEQKRHEVQAMSSLIATLCKAVQVDWVCDLGAGKGYLSSVLARYYKQNVLAIECSQSNVQAAQAYQLTLQKELNHQKKVSKEWRDTRSSASPDMAMEETSDVVKEVDLVYDGLKTGGRGGHTNGCGGHTDSRDGHTDSKDGHTDKEKYKKAPIVNSKTKKIDETNFTARKRDIFQKADHEDGCFEIENVNYNTSKEKSKLNSGVYLLIEKCITAEVNLSDILLEALQINRNNSKSEESDLKFYERVRTSMGPNITKNKKEKSKCYKENYQAGLDKQQKIQRNKIVHLCPNIKDLVHKVTAAGFTNHKILACLCGLHTCGDLASVMLQLFAQNEGDLSPLFMCGVGCCYHLLTEAFAREDQDLHYFRRNVNKDNFSNSQSFFSRDAFSAIADVCDDNFNARSAGKSRSAAVAADVCCGSHNARSAGGRGSCAGFPLSSYLTKERYSLGRNARMIAAQPAARLCHGTNKGTQKSQLWRSLLQLVLVSNLYHSEEVVLSGAVCKPVFSKQQLAAPNTRLGRTKTNVDDAQSDGTRSRPTTSVSAGTETSSKIQPLEDKQTCFVSVDVDFSDFLLRSTLTEELSALASFTVGRRLASQCRSFAEYAVKAIEKLPVVLQSRVKSNMPELTALESHFEGSCSQLAKLFLLRASLGPVIEGLVLLDRLAYVSEQDCCSAAFLLPLFNSAQSPRCHALVAFRTAR